MRHFFYKDNETKDLIFDQGLIKNQLHKEMGAYQDLRDLYKLSELQIDTKLESTRNRLPFTDIPGMQYILGSGEPDICFDELVAENFVILVKLNPGTLTGRFEEMKALGSIVLNAILVTQPQAPFSIYVDEVGDFGTAKLMQVLRKGLQENFVSYLAHQTIPQLDKSLFETIAATCQNKVVFRLPNPNDLHFISRTIQYPDNSSILLNLDEQWAAIKTIHDPVRVCQIVTVPDLPERDISDYLQSLYNDYDWYLNESTAKTLIHTRRSPDESTSGGRRKIFRFKKPDK